MRQAKKISIIFVIGLFAVIGMACSQQNDEPATTSEESVIHSPYVGEELRGIKALSQGDIEGLLAGAGTPFGGMAKPGELNGFPGPRHVLDAVAAGEFEISSEQNEQIEALYEEMRAEAIALGTQIIEVETVIDDAFKNGTVSETLLEERVSESAELYGRLRIVHLKYHLAMVDILSPQQVAQYNELRGYTLGDPCANVPEGHDPEMWKLHNNCG